MHGAADSGCNENAQLMRERSNYGLCWLQRKSWHLWRCTDAGVMDVSEGAQVPRAMRWDASGLVVCSSYDRNRLPRTANLPGRTMARIGLRMMFVVTNADCALQCSSACSELTGCFINVSRSWALASSNTTLEIALSTNNNNCDSATLPHPASGYAPPSLEPISNLPAYSTCNTGFRSCPPSS